MVMGRTQCHPQECSLPRKLTRAEESRAAWCSPPSPMEGYILPRSIGSSKCRIVRPPDQIDFILDGSPARPCPYPVWRLLDLGDAIGIAVKYQRSRRQISPSQVDVLIKTGVVITGLDHVLPSSDRMGVQGSLHNLFLESRSFLDDTDSSSYKCR